MKRRIHSNMRQCDGGEQREGEAELYFRKTYICMYMYANSLSLSLSLSHLGLNA